MYHNIKNKYLQMFKTKINMAHVWQPKRSDDLHVLESHCSCSCSAPRTVWELSENCDSTKGPTCRNYEIQQTLRMNISLLSSGSKNILSKLRKRRVVSCLAKKREPSQAESYMNRRFGES
jgi:hypothetical protein